MRPDQGTDTFRPGQRPDPRRADDADAADAKVRGFRFVNQMDSQRLARDSKVSARTACGAFDESTAGRWARITLSSPVGENLVDQLIICLSERVYESDTLQDKTILQIFGE